MSDPNEADILAGTRERTDQTVAELWTSVAKRNHNRVLYTEQRLRHERALTDIAPRLGSASQISN
jgi:uridine phosphorylase